jgi:hypothetical protein
MFELSEGDYRPLEEFRLAWRWNDPHQRVLPADVLAKVRPLTQDKAKGVYNQLGRRSLHEDEGFLPVSFRLVNKVNTSAIYPGVVRHWLEAHIQDHDQAIIVSWEPTIAVATTADIFCRFWDDFCYPSSDDVTILPLSEDWALVYWHEEELFFGKNKKP